MPLNELERILTMEVGEEVTVNWSEEGGGLVTKRDSKIWLLEEVPQYGGDPIFAGLYEEMDLCNLLKKAHSWT